MVKYLFAVLGILSVVSGFAQSSSIFFRNNTWNDFTVNVTQTGTTILPLTEWTQLQTEHHKWYPDTELASINRGLTPGDTVYLNVDLEAASDTVSFHFRLIESGGATSLHYSASTSTFSDSWYSNGSAHDFSATVSGKPVIIKYKPLNGDGSMDRDVLFAIHDDPVHEIDSADFSNPNVINYLCYNIQMLPFGFVGMPDADIRGDLLPAELSPNLDAVSFAEAFDPLPRTNNLEPAMAAAGFPYSTTILNDYAPFNGGIMIFSRWPIVATDEMDFSLCGAAAQDCFANKGVKYAAINKLGKIYHLFGTHMDAGSGADDIEAKNSQMGEIRDFISAQNIPQHEAVLFGGDFNVSPLSGDSLYHNFHDSIDPLVPQNIGYKCSTMDTITGKIIDHVWTDRIHLMPLTATNENLTFRSVDESLWDLSDFSDHRASLGRFEYPDLGAGSGDTILCVGDAHTFSVNSSIAATFQWMKDGVPIAAAISNTYTISSASAADNGSYSCQIGYTVMHGDTLDAVNALLHPFGPETINASIDVPAGMLTVDNALCGNAIDELSSMINLWPNPVSDELRISNTSGKPITRLLIISHTGQVVKKITRQNINVVGLKELSAGFYTVCLRAQDDQVIRKKICKL